MPVEHMVWMKWNPGVTKERIEHHLAGLRTLKGKVPGIVALSCGENFTNRSEGYTHGLIVTLESRAALDVYRDHPDHVAVAKPMAADAKLIAMDYEH